MTGEQFKELRRESKLSVFDMAAALGYGGNDRTMQRRIRRIEAADEVPESVMARLHRHRGLSRLIVAAVRRDAQHSVKMADMAQEQIRRIMKLREGL